MPTYEYRCKSCGEHLEVVQSFTDDALTSCPSCGAEQLRKVFGAVGISFKGSGFYKTDSRGSSSSTTSSTSAGATSSESGGSTSSDGAGSTTSTTTTTPASTSSDAKTA